MTELDFNKNRKESISFKLDIIENDILNTYSCTLNNIEQLESCLKEFETEKIISVKIYTPSGITNIENALEYYHYDEIVEYDIKSLSTFNSKEQEITAIIKNYPEIYNIIFKKKNQDIFKNLALYLSLEENSQAPKYMPTLSANEKKEIMTLFFSNLHWNLLNSQSLDTIYYQMDVVANMRNSKAQEALLNELEAQIKMALENTENLEILKQYTNQKRKSL